MKSFEDFINEYPKYRKYRENKEMRYVFNEIICNHTFLVDMLFYAKFGMPPLAVCIKSIEEYLETSYNTDLTDKFAKQAIGSMISFILYQFGYSQEKQVSIPKGYNAKYFTTSSTYRFNEKIVPTMGYETRISDIITENHLFIDKVLPI